MTSTILGRLDREPTNRGFSDGIIARTFFSVLDAWFWDRPTATSSQHVGMVTGQQDGQSGSVTFAAGILLVTGFVPNFAS